MANKDGPEKQLAQSPSRHLMEVKCLADTSQHSDEDCVNAISLMKHSVDEETVKQKMRSTFRYRRNMVEDPERCGDVLAEYPRFKDVKGLVSNDFQVDACIYSLSWVLS